MRNRSEQELAGYRSAMDYLFTEEWRPVNVGLLLHLHRLLFVHTETPGGAFKDDDNLVVDLAVFAAEYRVPARFVARAERVGWIRRASGLLGLPPAYRRVIHAERR